MCVERDVLDAVPGGQDAVGRHQHAPAAADVGEPRHGLGGDGLPADHRAGRRGGGESGEDGKGGGGGGAQRRMSARSM